ncbi:MAG: SDR family NAD(P)-dependent oxidoreductase [Planctomycetia bacterium]|nr:SDR family NAD(P)-dependent oxidoreductase [Planctomycetia bacterium]
MLLITGAAGFIGFHTVRRFLREGIPVAGLDNLNDYYNVDLKKARLRELEKEPNSSLFHFEKTDLADREGVARLFDQYSIDRVIHLAAQAGVRYSLTHPHAYVESNLTGFVNIMDACRLAGCDHLFYASSSSVYGANRKTPYSVSDRTDHPVSLYAATKRANELLAWSYSHLYHLPTTGLRFFTVYGPWGRPDMALFKFTDAIRNDRTIDVYNYGKMRRDFTYIDDIVEGIWRLNRINKPRWESWYQEEAKKNGEDPLPFALFNLGSQSPVELSEMIRTLERVLGKEAKKNMLPIQPGDMLETYADTSDLVRIIGPFVHTSLNSGIQQFVDWEQNHFQYFSN